MKHLHQIKEQLCEILEQYSQGEISRSDLETVHKLTDTIKNIDKIMAMEHGGYSKDGGWSAHGYYSRDSYRNDGSYDSGYSNKHYVRGHYSRDGYSREDNKERMMADLDTMLREGHMNPQDKEALERARQVLGR